MRLQLHRGLTHFASISPVVTDQAVGEQPTRQRRVLDEADLITGSPVCAS
jgi:hypothetical protein